MTEFYCKKEEASKMYVDEIDKESMLFLHEGIEYEKYYDKDGKFLYNVMGVLLSKQDVRKLVSKLEIWLNE